MMKRIIALLIFAGVVFVYWFMLNNPPRKTEVDGKPVVKVGVIYPMTGNIASIGIAGQIGIDMARKKIEEMNPKYQYEFILEDNQFDNAKTAVILNKLLHVDKVDAVIDSGAGVGNVTSPVLEKEKIIHFNWSSDPNVAKGKYNFINWTQPPAQAKKMVEIIEGKNYKNVWIVTANHSGPIAVTEGLEAELNKRNITNKVKKINMGTRDMRIDIEKIQQDKADLIVLVLFDPDLTVFLKQFREREGKADLTAIEVFSFLEDYSLVEGSWYIDAAEGNNEVTDEVRRITNSNVVLGASNSYDIVMMLFDAFEKAETKDQAVDELLKVKEYDGLTGKLVQDEEGIFQSEAVVKKIVNGKQVLVEE